MESERIDCTSEEARTGRSTYIVESRCKCQRLLEEGDHRNV